MQLFRNKNSRNAYNFGPMTLTSVAERLAVDLPIAVLKLKSVVAGIRTPNLFLTRQMV